MRPEDIITDEFLKQFKTGRELNDFLAQIQKRGIEKMLEGIVFKVRENSKVTNKTVYIAVGLRRDGFKEVLGMWLSKNESAAYWMTVLTDMKARGLEDILISATDNLNGFTQTIRSVFPQAATQICVVHQIRNSCRYVVWKDKKQFTSDLREAYAAPPARQPRLLWMPLKASGPVNMLMPSNAGGTTGRN